MPYFDRFIPEESPAVAIIITKGIKLKDASHPAKIQLHNITQESSGTYKCEVSADGPQFRTAVKYTKLKIAGRNFDYIHLILYLQNSNWSFQIGPFDSNWTFLVIFVFYLLLIISYIYLYSSRNTNNTSFLYS